MRYLVNGLFGALSWTSALAGLLLLYGWALGLCYVGALVAVLILDVLNGEVAAALSIVAAIGWAAVWSFVFWLGIALRNWVQRLARSYAAKSTKYATLRSARSFR